jgi:hypothetical protein
LPSPIGPDRSGFAVQCDQSGAGGREAATAEVERAQVFLEVDVQPFAAGVAGAVGTVYERYRLWPADGTWDICSG